MKRGLAAIAVAAAAAGATAMAAAPATTTFVPCAKVSAAGKSWTVAAIGVRCTTARQVVAEVAAKKPDRVLRAQGGEVDQFAAAFSGLKCFKSAKGKVGAIQCTSTNGKQSLLAEYK